MKKDKINEAIQHCYKELYNGSTPSADFDLLVENAQINEQGQKVIDFMSYEISHQDFDNIIDQTLKKYKIKDTPTKKLFKNSIYLGCSPKIKN
jgi:uncharacterized membrane-anchored protein YjiN (DUF445 family)